jgi:hypothetical protein
MMLQGNDLKRDEGQSKPQVSLAVSSPELMTEAELIAFLRIPEVSKATDPHNVIENLKRVHCLPRIHICGKPLYPREAIKEWIKRKTISK